jgi:hypothetical protein
MFARMAVSAVANAAAWRSSIAICLRAANLRRTIRIALVVGTVLTLINQVDVIVAGDATALTLVKVALNFCVPFVVSNLGVLAGTHTAGS